MIKQLEDAIAKIRALPEDRQAYAAMILDEIADFETETYTLSATERALIREALDDLAAERVVSPAEMDAFWVRNRK